MRALRDITDSAEAGVFSYVLTQKIMALEVVTNRLETEIINLRTGGVIHSDNYRTSGGALGWMIDYLGDAVFNNLRARGRFNGTFKLV